MATSPSSYCECVNIKEFGQYGQFTSPHHFWGRFSFCHQCHMVINDKSKRFLILRDTTLEVICSKCLEMSILHNKHMQQCEACNQPTHTLFLHHWWLPNNTRTMHRRKLCCSCNSKLSVNHVWAKHPFLPFIIPLHLPILPTWHLQLVYINDRKAFWHNRDITYSKIKLRWVTP
jgi:hypothetical protein